VLRIDFNTAGANDTVSLWIDPLAGVADPGVNPNVVDSTFDVGTISAFGINALGAFAFGLDEIRVGDLYGDVVGYGLVAAPTIPTTLAISVAQGLEVSWTASSANNYQPQKSADNSSWANFGGYFLGNSVSSVYETNAAAYYRVLELLLGGPGPDTMVNGGFETAAANSLGIANWNGPASNGTANQYATNQYDVLTPTEGAAMLLMEGTNVAGSVVSSDLLPIAGGLTYAVVFDAANPVKTGGGNPQYRLEFFDAGNGYISSTTWGSVGAAGAAWVTISNNYPAPANAGKLHIQFLEAVGGGGHWVTLYDNVRVSALATIAGTNVLSPTLQLGARFAATISSNGVAPATLASGTVAFLTNSVGLSTNTAAAGGATSATAILTPPFTVTAIYSGDSTYIGSTNTLSVSHALAAVTLGSLSQTYDGTARHATASTVPPGLTLQLTYNGSASAPTNAGTYQVVGTVVDALYAGSSTDSLVIAQAPATVTLGSLNQTYDGTPKHATATTTPPGLTVSFTYDGSAAAPVNPGTYAVVGTVVDLNYVGSAADSLVISGSIVTPPNIVFNVSNNQLNLSWPADAGWSLESQTNSLSVGLNAVWHDVAGSDTTNQMSFPLNKANPAVFFRLKHAP
jgi:hypothetical protein